MKDFYLNHRIQRKIEQQIFSNEQDVDDILSDVKPSYTPDGPGH